jgi:nucleotide-binding universal stress UspA family protein
LRAIELAKNDGADLRIVTVDDIRLAQAEAMAAIAITVPYGTIDNGSREIAASSQRRAENAGLHAEAIVVPMADPASEIVRQARSHDAEMVIMGSHGRTGIARVLLGSVAEKVVRLAPCSVLVVR